MLKAHGFAVVPLAEPIKLMLRALGLSEPQLYGTEKETPLDALCGKSPRHALQTLGTEWGRQHIGEEVWLRAWWSKCATIVGHVACDDVRFPDEAEFVRSKGGVIVKVSRPGVEAGDHPTEKQQFTPDLEIVNAGTRQDLAETVRSLYERLQTAAPVEP